MPIRRGDDSSYTLLSNGAATGSGVNIRGGEYMFFANGTIGGATVQLEMLSPSNTWTTVQVFTGSLVRFTALPANQSGISLPAGQVRFAVSGGTPSGLSAFLVGCG
jgi:hypothetical protein